MHLTERKKSSKPMTTLTTRPIPLLPLVLPISMYCNDRPSSSTGSSPPLPPRVPCGPSASVASSDGLLLARHQDVTSPRISSTTSSSYNSSCRLGEDSPPIRATDRDEERTSRNFILMDRDLDRIDDTDQVNDRMSCCSDDSELSVGREGCDSSVTKDRFRSATNKNRRAVEYSESVDSVSDENRLAAGSEPLCNDEASSDSNSFRESDPSLAPGATLMGMPPASIIRPSPTRLQEEFLRKSHLYAEQLMKQQMQFMAVARANAFSLHHGAISPEICKVGFRPPGEIANSFTNFTGIQSHLNAISKISSQLSCEESALSKLTAFGMNHARDPTKSPPTSLNHLSPHHPNHPLLQHQLINNNLNESNLKFSIDNILKADFGRRITDPILKRGSSASHSNGGHGKSSTAGSRRGAHRNSATEKRHHGAPMDLTSSLNVAGVSVNNNNNNSSSAISTVRSISPASVDNLPTAKSSESIPSSPNPSITSTTSSQSPGTPAAPTASATAAAGASASNGGGSTESGGGSSSSSGSGGPMVWPAWVYCTRYSDRPSSGPRARKPKKPPSEKGTNSSDEKRPRTAFSGPQLARLKHEFNENRYLTERRRQQLSAELGLNEAQIKIWFQNKRAKIKKASGTKNPLALQLMAQGLYNHSTVPLTREEEELQEMQEMHAKSAA